MQRMAAAKIVPFAPRGRERVVAALVEAATALFAERGPAGVSVRDIAARAGVNHGLLHRHFGSKQRLLRVVLDRLMRELATSVPLEMSSEGLRELFTAVAGRETYWRALARAVLDGEAPRLLQSRFPLVEHLVEGLTELQRAGALGREFDPRLVAAGIAAQVLGWLVFEPFLATAAGLGSGVRDRNRRALVDAMLAILSRMGDSHDDHPKLARARRPRGRARR
jgi:AcrR family transcriptional regulator